MFVKPVLNFWDKFVSLFLLNNSNRDRKRKKDNKSISKYKRKRCHKSYLKIVQISFPLIKHMNQDKIKFFKRKNYCRNHVTFQRQNDQKPKIKLLMIMHGRRVKVNFRRPLLFIFIFGQSSQYFFYALSHLRTYCHLFFKDVVLYVSFFNF